MFENQNNNKTTNEDQSLQTGISKIEDEPNPNIEKEENKINPISTEQNAPYPEDVNNVESIEKVDLSLERNYGRTFPLIKFKGEPIILIGPQWHYFIFVYLPSLGIYIIVMMLKELSIFFKYIYILYFIFYSINYVLLCFKNNGIPSDKKKDAINNPNDYLQCRYCNCMVHKDNPYITFHCNICEVCVENFDHHCPFATKCIGNGNKINFTLFLISLPIFIVINIIYIFI